MVQFKRFSFTPDSAMNDRTRLDVTFIDDAGKPRSYVYPNFPEAVYKQLKKIVAHNPGAVLQVLKKYPSKRIGQNPERPQQPQQQELPFEDLRLILRRRLFGNDSF